MIFIIINIHNFSFFYWIILISNNKLIFINLKYIPNFWELYLIILWFLKYTINNLSKKEFKSLKDFINEEKNQKQIDDKNNLENLKKLPDPKINILLNYVPLINLICLKDFKTKNKFHVINWILITLLWIILFFINVQFCYILIFPILFSIWYTKFLEYKLPFLFDLYWILKFLYKKSISNNIKKETSKEISFLE